MNVIQAIKGRRTIHDFTSDPVEKQQVETMLEAAIWAPNHKLTNPWEFYVVSGGAKEHLARLRGQLKSAKAGDPESPQARKSYENAYREMAAVPYAILIVQKLTDDPVRRAEDTLAVGCAIQNLMLAAHSMGIGTFWGTGPLLNHPETFRTLGVPEGRQGVGMVLVGYPAREKAPPAREPLAAHVNWVE